MCLCKTCAGAHIHLLALAIPSLVRFAHAKYQFSRKPPAVAQLLCKYEEFACSVVTIRYKLNAGHWISSSLTCYRGRQRLWRRLLEAVVGVSKLTLDFARLLAQSACRTESADTSTVQVPSEVSGNYSYRAMSERCHKHACIWFQSETLHTIHR